MEENISWRFHTKTPRKCPFQSTTLKFVLIRLCWVWSSKMTAPVLPFASHSPWLISGFADQYHISRLLHSTSLAYVLWMADANRNEPGLFSIAGLWNLTNRGIQLYSRPGHSITGWTTESQHYFDRSAFVPSVDVRSARTCHGVHPRTSPIPKHRTEASTCCSSIWVSK
jgi:hypothetical protein